MDSQRLIHELEVHQVELEMQNAELCQTRGETETALKKFTDLYDFAPVGYFTLDREGVIRDVNLTGASFLGTGRSLLLGQRFGLFIVDIARPDFTAFLSKAFESRGKKACELTLLKGGIQPLYAQIEALAGKSGGEKIWRVAVIDITERRHAEDELAEKRRELEEINLSLIKALDELHRKEKMLIMQGRNAAMGEMINNIAHHWRQPLNALGLIIQQMPLFHDTGQLSKEYLEEMSGKAMQLIQHMSRTIDDFRNFFRSDEEMKAFYVNQVLRQTVLLIEDSFKAQRIIIALHTKGNPMITGYPNEYAQVLLNILMNTRDALVERDVVDPWISLRSYAEWGKSVVTIADNAGGISEDIMDKLFDPYFTTKGPDKGTGIGLFMSKTIIEKNMGGKLSAQYRQRRGIQDRGLTA